MRKLNEVKINEEVVVQKVSGDKALKRKILDMGITKGTSIFVRKVAPLGDPIEIKVRGYELTIRKQEAALIEVA